MNYKPHRALAPNEYTEATKGGRCFNGAHRDAGVIVHYVRKMEYGCAGYWGDKALCGTEPGRRGYGWNVSTKNVNCPKCIKRYEKIIQSVSPED